jgi:hypothetical protein
MKTITICSSANFYKQVIELQAQLEKLGYRVLVPSTAERMKASGDYEVEHYKTWFKDANDYAKKTELMRGHFDKVAEADAILVVNNEKHGRMNYIGGNVLMEMTLAFYQHKPICLLNDAPEASDFLEEIIGLEPKMLHGDVRQIVQYVQPAV